MRDTQKVLMPYIVHIRHIDMNKGCSRLRRFNDHVDATFS